MNEDSEERRSETVRAVIVMTQIETKAVNTPDHPLLLWRLLLDKIIILVIILGRCRSSCSCTVSKRTTRVSPYLFIFSRQQQVAEERARQQLREYRSALSATRAAW